MNASAELVLKNFSGAPEIVPDAHELKKQALEASVAVTQVVTEEELSVAVKALRLLKTVSKGIEASRKSVKRPVLDLGGKIDEVAHEFIAPVDKEENRLSGIINHYQRKQLEGRRAEEQQAAQDMRNAETARANAESLRVQAESISDEAKKSKLLAQAGTLEERATDLSLGAEVTAGDQLAIAKPKGLVVRQRWTFQVTNPLLFASGYPQFWRWNEETETLKLSREMILLQLNKAGGGLFHKSRFPEELPAKMGDPVQPAGLRVYEEIKAHTR